MHLVYRLSIRTKLILMTLSVTSMTVVLGFLFVIYNDIRTFRSDLVDQTGITAKLIGEYCVAPLTFSYAADVADILAKIETIPYLSSAHVYDEEGHLFAAHHPVEGITVPEHLPVEGISYFQDDALHVFQPIRFRGNTYGTIYLQASTAFLAAKIREHILIMILSMGGLLVISYGLASIFQKFISRPVLNLAQIMGKISTEEDYTLRVQKVSQDEIGMLYDGFNTMLAQIQLRQLERDKAEQRLQEKNKELEQVIYVTSHDLRSPLVNIQGFSKELEFLLQSIESLLKSVEMPVATRRRLDLLFQQEIPEALHFILTSGEKMDSLLNGLLRLSRTGRAALHPEPLDMNQLVANVISEFEFQLKEHGITLTLDDLPACWGDRLQINQVFANIIGNAIKYLDPHRPGKIHISGTVAGNTAIYTVQDNGIGIAANHQTKVFEIFYRLNPKDSAGEGLGLSIVRKILSRHQGRVWLESQPGQGTTVYIELPCVPHEEVV